MIVEKVVLILIEIIFIVLLGIKYTRNHYKENLVIIPILIATFSIYIFYTLKLVYIPIYVQCLVFLFGFIIPLIAIVLQYNNIIIRNKILYYRIKYLYFLKEYEKVIKYIVKLLHYEQNNSEYLYILGMCYKNMGDYINARDSFALAVEKNKNDYMSYYELGLILDETNKKEIAVIMFNKAISINDYFYDAREALGICYTSQGKFKEAVRVYKKALKKHPKAYELYYNIAVLEVEMQEYDKAKLAFIKAIEIKPDLYTALNNLGNLYYLTGEYEEAKNLYKKMLNSGIYAAKAYFKVAKCYASLKENEKAMAALEYAIELDFQYIDKVKEETVFYSMKNLIDNYLIDREILKNKEKERNNYITNKFKLFKKEEDKFFDYEKKYNNYSFLENQESIRHA